MVVGVIVLIHWSIYKLLAWITTSIISVVLIFSFYYFSMRGLVRMIAFPGISTLFRRGLEYDYGKRMS